MVNIFKHFLNFFLALTLQAIFIANLFAANSDLIEIYEKAVNYDALLSASRYQNEATKELINQGRSLFLPSINASGGYDEKDNERKILTPGVSSNELLSGNKADFHSYDYNITITQPLFDYGAFQQYKQIISQTNLSDKQLVQSQQDLIYRVSLVYFETLMARDEIELLEAQKKAVNEQLLESEARFEAGLLSITDVNEAKTKMALIEAQLIAAMQKLKIKRQQIKTITGEEPGILKGLNVGMNFVQISSDIDEWVNLGLQNNLELGIAQDQVTIADYEIGVRQADHLPTVDAIATRSRNWDKGGFPYGATENKGIRSYSDVLGVEINIPIFSGGYTSSRVREAKLLKFKTEEDAEYLKREVELKIRENFLNLQANFAEIEAYFQALKSAELSLESTQLAFQEGLRNGVEVLVAQQVLFNAKRDLLKSRYNYLIYLISLKLSAGMLTRNDIQEINQYLTVNEI